MGTQIIPSGIGERWVPMQILWEQHLLPPSFKAPFQAHARGSCRREFDTYSWPRRACATCGTVFQVNNKFVSWHWNICGTVPPMYCRLDQVTCRSGWIDITGKLPTLHLTNKLGCCDDSSAQSIQPIQNLTQNASLIAVWC